MGTMTAAAPTLESLNAKIVELRDQQHGLQLDLDRLAARVANHAAQRRELLLNPNTAAVKNQVESIERAMADLEREEESLQLRIDALTGPIQVAETERAEMMQKAAAVERARQDEELIAEIKKDVWNISASFRALCRMKFNLDERVRQLDERQQSLVLPIVLEGLRQPVTWNEKWTTSSYKLPSILTVLDACAPDELRHLEELK